MMIIYVAIIFCYLHGTISENFFNVDVDSKSPIYTIPDPARFLSIALDMTVIANSPDWFGLNFSYVEPLAKALGPAYFRFGGWQADLVSFKESNYIENVIFTTKKRFNQDGSYENYTMTGTQIDQLYTFIKNVGWDFIFDLNQGGHFDGNKWNSTNAKQLIDYFNAHGYIMNFELGNEPDLYQHVLNYSMTGAQIADAYGMLREILNTYDLYKNSIIMGPSLADAVDNNKLLRDFLDNKGGNYINALSIHHYTPLWLGETGSTWASSYGAETFAASFWWLDKLGVSSLYKLDIVVREDFFGQWFSLLDFSMKPLPDYWLSFLYKKLIGQQVLNVTFEPADPYLRLYGASTTSNNGFFVYGTRLSNTSATLDFPSLTSRQVTAYILKEGDPGNLYSSDSLLNGELLKWTTHQPGSNFKGNLTTLPIEIPPHSLFFLVLNQSTNSNQCPNGWYKETSNANKCIKVLNETRPLFAAKFECGVVGNNASILSIENVFENSEIIQQVGASSCGQFYIGLERNGNNWLWSNGNSNSYQNWQKGFPINDDNRNCVIIDTKSGTWTNVDCDHSQCFICQQSI